jgi:ABC-type transport system involved in multi-copper enzyme maturation permease subunit
MSAAGDFGRLVRAEWTKLRTVRGWVIAMLVAAAAIIGLGVMPGYQGSCGRNGPQSECSLPVGPGGEEVTDSFYFVHQSLTGDGSITVRLTAMTGLLPSPPSDDHGGGAGPAKAEGGGDAGQPGLVPWAKAGIILKANTGQGSSYAALMLTGTQGVRMQYDYTHDIAGAAGGVSAQSPRWLRLTRAADTITGEQSADGSQWTKVGTARLDDLPSTIEAGLFATSPQYTESSSEAFGLSGAMSGPSQATGVFDSVQRQGGWSGSDFKGEAIGAFSNAGQLEQGRFEQDGERFTVTGSGDIAPAVTGAAGLGTSITQTLVGTFAGLILVVVVGTMFVTAEYGRGVMRTTVSASPRRGRILAAKALVIGAVTFVTGLAAAAAVVSLGQRVLRANGVYVHAVSTFTQLRVIVGTAALLAMAAVLALALGVILRRSAAAVTTAVLGIVLPYLLAMTVLPAGAGQWLLRVTPAAAFAVQQSALEYPQVLNIYTPVNGYFPLSALAGFGVLCGWTALALGVAGFLLRRRDA